MGLSFNLNLMKNSQAPKMPALPPTIPLGRLSQSSGNKVYRSIRELENKDIDQKTSDLRKDKRYGKTEKESIFSRIFRRSYKTKKGVLGESIDDVLGYEKRKGIKRSFEELGYKRKNWGPADKALAAQILEEEMGKSPHLMTRSGEEGTIPRFIQQKILQRLHEKEREGRFSDTNLKDVEEILKNIRY